MPIVRNKLPWNVAVKPFPAIADLSAIVDRMLVTANITGNGNAMSNNIYTVQAGELVRCIAFTGVSSNGTARVLLPYIKEGAVEYYLGKMNVSGVWTPTGVQFDGIAKEGDIIGVRWDGTTSAASYYNNLIAYKIPVY